MELQQTQRRTVASRYAIHARIETHGSSRLYHATHAETGRLVALREFEPAHCAAPDVLATLEKARSLSSRFLATLVEVAPVEGDTLYVAHALLNGEALTERLRRKGALKPAEAAALCVRALKGLEALHRRGLVHGGLRLSRMFHQKVQDGGWHVKLLGACVPTITRDDVQRSFELVHYAPPDWLDGGAWTEREDVWCMGAILYECITLRSPFAESSTGRIARRILSGEMDVLADVAKDVPRALSSLVGRALSRDSASRPASAGALLGELLEIFPETEPVSRKTRGEKWTRGQQVGAKVVGGAFTAAESRTETIRRQRREISRAWWAGVAATTCLAALIGIVLYPRAARRPNQSSARVSSTATSGESVAATEPSSGHSVPAAVVEQTSQMPPRQDPAGSRFVSPRASVRSAMAVHQGSVQDLGPDSGTLEFRTPSACALILDGSDRGEVTALRLALSVGVHRLTCRTRSGTQRLAFQVFRGRSTRVQIVPTGEAEVTTEEPGHAAAP